MEEKILMNVWNACGIRDYEVIPEHDGIGLYRVGAHGVEQEMYFLIKQEYSDWNTYLIQRGKQYKRYTALLLKLHKSVCVCFLSSTSCFVRMRFNGRKRTS